jgi:hypothetical protein
VAESPASPLVAPAHRPTLGDLTRGWPRRRRVAVVAVVVAAALAAVAAWLLVRGDDAVRVVVDGPLAFNLRHPPEMTRRAPRGDEVLRLERRRPDGLFVDAFVVEPLVLPPYRGEPSGALPVFAVAEIAALERRYGAFEWAREGKTRVNEVPGYAVQFRARLGERRLYGRVVLLPEPRPAARRGARLVLLATPAAGVANAGDVGSTGAHALPYRSFRFGTEPP